MSIQSQSGHPATKAKSGQTEPRPSRGQFWRYCQRTVHLSAARAERKGVPHAIDAHDIDRLLVDQSWRCAVSGIPLVAPEGRPGPFTPSLDRIVPSLGYVPGNVRIVCNLVNVAMNKWGEEPLRVLLTAIHAAERDHLGKP